MTEKHDTPIMSVPDAEAIAAYVTPFPDFTASTDEWRVRDVAYQRSAAVLARIIDAEEARQ